MCVRGGGRTAGEDKIKPDPETQGAPSPFPPASCFGEIHKILINITLFFCLFYFKTNISELLSAWAFRKCTETTLESINIIF